VPLAEGDARLIFPADLEKFRAFKLPKKPAYVLTAGIDGLVLLRRALAELLDGEHPLLAGKTDLPSHAIFDRGRLIGLWEYDVETESIAWTAFIPQDAALKKSVASMENYVRTQLGDARSFSLDSPKSRAPRIAALRAG
jgi:hypothetical protein